MLLKNLEQYTFKQEKIGRGIAAISKYLRGYRQEEEGFLLCSKCVMTTRDYSVLHGRISLSVSTAGPPVK